jgi:tripartite-type tricarboxylate transporter receptor subunit TctC
MRTAILIATCLLATCPARAQDDAAKYPLRPIHLIVGFAAGGGNDVIARIYAQTISASP